MKIDVLGTPRLNGKLLKPGVQDVPNEVAVVWLNKGIAKPATNKGDQTPEDPQGDQTPEDPDGDQTPEDPDGDKTPEDQKASQKKKGSK